MASSFLRKDTFLLLEGSEMRKARNAGVGEGWPHYFLFGMGLTRQVQKLRASGASRLEIFTGRITSSSAD
ncbi:hypothetical protein CEP53_010513 [Fusarium sp. AF-6]|nr:hypothetical protein CEP53_010513 [Fusarium sp. AF-6]